MEYPEAVRFVKDWLWDSRQFGSMRSTDSKAWSDEHRQDAARMVRDATQQRKTSAAKELPKPAPNTTQAKICQDIVEDIMNFFHRDTGFFMHMEGSRQTEIRDRLFRIVSGKLSAVR